MRTRFHVLAAMLVALTLVAAGCGDDSGSRDSGSDTTGPTTQDQTDDPSGCGLKLHESDVTGEFPVTFTAASGSEITLDEVPDAIVSISASSTEMLFALGAGDQVVAVDDFSDCPTDAPIADGLSGFEPNVESIAALEPDLVVMSFDPGGIVDGLAVLDIPTLVQFSAVTIDDTYTQITELGTATGRVEGAAELNEQIAADLAAAVASIEVTDPAPTYYHELDDTFYTATSSTFIGEVYALAGLENIADPADDGSGFPQLSQEFIVDADPDFIFLADTVCCGQSGETVADRPGWAEMTAVAQGQVVELDDGVASRWGPRITNLLTIVASAVAGS